MATITEDYVSFETAKLLKEKGFDARCPMIYTVDGEMLYTDVKHHNMYAVTNKQLEYYTDIIAPTQAMAMKWLREKNISIELSAARSHYWVYTIYKILSNKVEEIYPDGGFKTYEEAVKDAIKYCLENLI